MKDVLYALVETETGKRISNLYSSKELALCAAKYKWRKTSKGIEVGEYTVFRVVDIPEQSVKLEEE